jgi:hypothetical protein
MIVASAAEVIETLRCAGLSLVLTPESTIRVTPASCLTPALREAIRDNKALLMDWLGSKAANDDWNVYIPPGTSPATIAKFRAASMALDATQAYLDHHFKCPTCTAAGKGQRYGQRCDLGAALLQRYNDTP